jgi:hypothetical protein
MSCGSEKHTLTLFVFLFCVLTFGISCQGGERNIVKHPNNEYKPYKSKERKTFKKREHRVGKVLDDIERLDVKDKNTNQIIFAENPRSIEVVKIGSKKLILDKSNHILYLLEKGESNVDTVATGGGGPGNTSFPRGIDVKGNKALIGTYDFRIVVYKCESNCTYDKTIRTKFSVKDIQYSGGGYSTIGYTTKEGFPRDVEVEKDKFSNAIQVVNNEGNITNSFGEKYAPESFLVRNEMSNGYLEKVSRNAKVVAYNRLNELYIYKNEKIDFICEMGKFYERKSIYNKKKGQVNTDPNESFSIVSNVFSIDDKEAVVVTKNVVKKDGSSKVEKINSKYYVVDVGTRECSYIGEVQEGDRSGPRLLSLFQDEVFVYEDGKVIRSNLES